MKNYARILTLFLLGAATAGAQDLGIGPLVSYQSTSNTVAGNTTTDTGLSLGLTVPIFLSGNLEVTPEFRYNAAWEDATNTAQNGLLLGAGVYWNMVTAGPWSFKTGAGMFFTTDFMPTTDGNADYASYQKVGLLLNVPLILDLALGQNLNLRIMQTTALLDWDNESRENGLGITSGTQTVDFRTFYQGLNPAFSFYWKF